VLMHLCERTFVCARARLCACACVRVRLNVHASECAHVCVCACACALVPHVLNIPGQHRLCCKGRGVTYGTCVAAQAVGMEA